MDCGTPLASSLREAVGRNRDVRAVSYRVSFSSGNVTDEVIAKIANI